VIIPRETSKIGSIGARSKIVVIMVSMLLILSGSIQAQNGLFVRFSLGPGFMKEFTSIEGSGPTLASKNHAIGWGFSDRYAIYIGEFGGLIKKPVGEYSYINLDAAGLGVRYRTPWDLDISVGAGYGQVALAENWKEPIGDIDGEGWGINLSIEKTWQVGDHWRLGAGPQAFYLTTQDREYDFASMSFNVVINFCFRRS